MIFFLTKSSYTNCYQFWTKMPRPKLGLDGTTFVRSDALNEHLDNVPKLFPKLEIKGEYGMKRVEIIEKDDGYMIRETK